MVSRMTAQVRRTNSELRHQICENVPEKVINGPENIILALATLHPTSTLVRPTQN